MCGQNRKGKKKLKNNKKEQEKGEEKKAMPMKLSPSQKRR